MQLVITKLACTCVTQHLTNAREMSRLTALSPQVSKDTPTIHVSHRWDSHPRHKDIFCTFCTHHIYHTAPNHSHIVYRLVPSSTRRDCSLCTTQMFMAIPSNPQCPSQRHGQLEREPHPLVWEHQQRGLSTPAHAICQGTNMVPPANAHGLRASRHLNSTLVRLFSLGSLYVLFLSSFSPVASSLVRGRSESEAVESTEAAVALSSSSRSLPCCAAWIIW